MLGHDVVRDAATVRQKVSLTGQYASVDEDLTGHENLVLVGRLLGLSWRDARARAAELLDAFGLADAAARQVRTYSGGMRRRIDIAASLVAIPEILFLDEPTTGLDPRSRNQVWELVRRIAAEGTTVLLTTQYLDEADRLAERLAVIDHGRVIAEGHQPRPQGVGRLARAAPAARERGAAGAGARAGRRGCWATASLPATDADRGGRAAGEPGAGGGRARRADRGTASRSRSSRSGTRAWTRCSSRSPAAPPRATEASRTPTP